MKRMNWLAPAFTLALAASALFASHVPASLAQQEQQRRKGTERVPGGCFICGNIPGVHTESFEGADWFGTLAWDACPIKKYSEDHPEELKGICQKIKAKLKFTFFKDSCPSLAPYCEPEEKKPDEKNPKCENYSGEITCDCNADGQDETTKAFESCGLPSNWPRQFKSRCEDWVKTDGGYGYGTDIAIQHQAQDYLASLKCPALKCHREYKACEQEAQEEYEKCIYSGVRRVRVSCLRQQNAANNKCVQNRDNCMRQIRRFGPGTGPRPQPLPTPTQTPPA
jgi:hypothetical protein